MTDKDNNSQVKTISNEHSWLDWVNDSKDSNEARLKELIKKIIFDEGVFTNDILAIIMIFEKSDHLKILDLILNSCDLETPRKIPLRIAFGIFYNMESDELYEYDSCVENDDDILKGVIITQKVYRIRDFLKKVDEYISWNFF